MGLLDRDYYRDEPRGVFFGGDRSMVTNLIIINVVVYVVDAIFFDGRLMLGMALKSNLLQEPWNVWQLITYGFAHSPGGPGFSRDIWHIVFNMLALWFFGRDVEGIYGKKLFLQLYLSLVILSGLCWLATVYRSDVVIPLVGASGAVFGIMLVYVMHFPHRNIYIYGIIPVKAWFFMAAYLIMEFAALNRQDYVAHAAHLGGAAFGFVFYKTRWTLFTWFPDRLPRRSLARRPALRLHTPDHDDELLSQRVDEILEKISREGEASLTKEERRVLEDASRRYQKRRG